MRVRHALAAFAVAALTVPLAAAAAPAATAPVSGQGHVQNVGWMPTTAGVIGTTGRALRLEAVRLPGPVYVTVHVQDIGWMRRVDMQDPGATAGTTGRALRMEAIKVELAPYWDTESTGAHIEYRCHLQDIGWTGWVRDGAVCGTTGQARRMEALEVRHVTRDTTPTPTPTPTATVTDPGDGVSLGIAADTGIDDPAGHAVLASLGQSAPTQSVILGDLAYAPAREADYCRLVRDRVTSPVAAIPGTHEGVSVGDGAWSAYAACLPAAVNGDYLAGEWYIDRGPVRLITLSPGVDLPTGTRTYARGTPERERVKDWIDDAKTRGLWVVVGMHHGCLTIGVHGCASDPSITDMLIGKGVDVVLAGHDHNYARSHQITGTVAAPAVADRDGAFRAGAGTVMVTVGNGGHNPRTIGSLGSLWAAGSGTNSPGGITYGWVRLDASATSLTGRLVTAAGPSLTDSWTITR